MRILILAMLTSLFALPGLAQLDASNTAARDAYRQGLLFERRADPDNANIQFEIACDGGDVRGCLALAHNHRTGNRIPQNFETAAGWYAIACERNAAAGCAALGYMANKGLGLDQSYPQSLEFYQRACDLGDASGCAGAGNLLFTGTGVDRNRRAGGDLLRKACTLKYDWACTRLDDLGQPRKIGG